MWGPMILLSCDVSEGPYAKWNKSDTSQWLYDHIHIYVYMYVLQKEQLQKWLPKAKGQVGRGGKTWANCTKFHLVYSSGSQPS